MRDNIRLGFASFLTVILPLEKSGNKICPMLAQRLLRQDADIGTIIIGSIPAQMTMLLHRRQRGHLIIFMMRLKERSGRAGEIDRHPRCSERHGIYGGDRHYSDSLRAPLLHRFHLHKIRISRTIAFRC
jgi:hypothetical protein